MVSTDVWHVEHQEELLLMYGRVAVRWAAADLLLAQILGLVLGNDTAGHSLVFKAAGSGQQRIQTFNNVIGASSLSENERGQVLEVTDKLSRLLPARNDIIHSPLTINLAIEGSKIVPSTAKVLKSGRTVKLSLDDVSAHVTDLGGALSQLEQFWSDLDDRLNPLEDDFIPAED